MHLYCLLFTLQFILTASYTQVLIHLASGTLCCF